jgi:hypothetical protein
VNEALQLDSRHSRTFLQMFRDTGAEELQFVGGDHVRLEFVE